MTGSIRLLTGLVLLTAALRGLDAAWPTWMEQLGQGQFPSGARMWELSPRQPEHELIAERMEARRVVVRRLAAGELTLFEAAARFRLLNNTPPNVPDRGWHLCEGRCEGEKLCRQVMQWGETVLMEAGAPGETEALLRGWADELAAHIARNGRVVLPGS